jgi:putative lipoprotein
MKPIFIAVLLTASICPAQAQHLEKDKVQHIVVSAGFGVVVAAAKPDWTSSEQFLVAMIPGLMKETYDARNGGTGFSAKDLLADAAGAFAGVQGWRWLVVPKAGGGAEVSWNTKF